jgi:hypothetical protein
MATIICQRCNDDARTENGQVYGYTGPFPLCESCYHVTIQPILRQQALQGATQGLNSGRESQVIFYTEQEAHRAKLLAQDVADTMSRNIGWLSDMKARDKAWRQACEDAAQIGYSRMPDMDMAVITSEMLAELQEKARKWDEMQADMARMKKHEEGALMAMGLEPVDRKPFESGRALQALGMLHAKEQVEQLTEMVTRNMKLLGAKVWDSSVTKVHAPREQGKGLRDGSGKYTEPGEPVIYLDSGWDD